MLDRARGHRRQIGDLLDGDRKTDVGEAPVDLARGDLDLHARQRGTDAAMHADAEGDVLHQVAAIDVEIPRAGELVGIVVAGRIQHQHVRVLRQLDPTEFGLAGGHLGQTAYRGFEAQQLLDETVQRTVVVDRGLQRDTHLGPRGQQEQQVAEGRGRRVVAGDDQGAHQRYGFRKRQLAAVVERGMDDVGNHVLARLGLARLHLADDEVLQLADQRGVADHLLAVLHLRDLRGDRTRPALDLVGIELLDAHLLADDADRHRHREILDAVDDGAVLRLFGQLLDLVDDHRRDARLDRSDTVRGEGLVEQAPHARVRGRVVLDRVRKEAAAIAFENLLELLEVAAGVHRLVAMLVRVRERIAQQRDDVLVTRHQPHLELFVVVNRRFAAQRLVERIRLRPHLRIGERRIRQRSRDRTAGCHGLTRTHL